MTRKHADATKLSEERKIDICLSCKFFKQKDNGMFCAHPDIKEEGGSRILINRCSGNCWEFCPKRLKNRCVYNKMVWCVNSMNKKEIGFCLLFCDLKREKKYNCQKMTFGNALKKIKKAIK